MNNIELTENDLRVAAHVAFDRGLQSLMAGSRNVNGGMADPFLRHVIGAAGECAFAKYMDIYWDGSVGRFRGQGNDVGAYQVRARSARLPMIIRPSDTDTDIFVLVCMQGNLSKWEVVGWITGAEGKKIGTPTPMQGGQRYQVDISHLHKIKEEA